MFQQNLIFKRILFCLLVSTMSIDAKNLDEVTLRVAKLSDVPALNELIKLSAVSLSGGYYSTEEISESDVQNHVAKIRAFFIHPDFARQGLATLLMMRCEHEAKNDGFKKVELISTLPGIPFYEKQGFVGSEL